MSKWVWLASAALISSSVGAAAPDTSRIVDEGMNRSRIMLNAHELLDGIGPRLTISTNMRRAQDWAVAKFTGYGLTNVHREGFAFGRGWDLIGSSVRLSGPRSMQLTAIPNAWTPPAKGVTGPVVVAPMNRPGFPPPIAASWPARSSWFRFRATSRSHLRPRSSA